ncbi:MAG: PAS domain S-box protein, partial [Planctomycetota bacterium]
MASSGSKKSHSKNITPAQEEKRKKAMEALRESEEKYRSLYGSVHAGIILQSIDGRIIHVNELA